MDSRLTISSTLQVFYIQSYKEIKVNKALNGIILHWDWLKIANIFLLKVEPILWGICEIDLKYFKTGVKDLNVVIKL